MIWKRVRPGLYRGSNRAGSRVALVERGDETGSWWWERSGGGGGVVAGRSSTLRDAKHRAEGAKA
jgi:hypothetical protein